MPAYQGCLSLVPADANLGGAGACVSLAMGGARRGRRRWNVERELPPAEESSHGLPLPALDLACLPEGDVWLRALDMASTAEGSRLLQAAILDKNTLAQNIQVAAAFRGSVRRTVTCLHGNHVLQCLVKMLPPPSVLFFLTELQEQWTGVDMARHRLGCRVLERLLEHCDAWPASGAAIHNFLNLRRHVGHLSEDRYGNYVVQHALEHGTETDRSIVLRHVTMNLSEMALHATAARVLDAALLVAPARTQRRLLEGLVGADGLVGRMLASDEKSMEFAVQRVVSLASKPMLEELLSAIPSTHKLWSLATSRYLTSDGPGRATPPQHIEVVTRVRVCTAQA